MTSPTPSAEMEKRTMCAACGAWGPVTEYHPFALCVLVKAIGEDAAKGNLKAVVEHTRREVLEEAAREAEHWRKLMLAAGINDESVICAVGSTLADNIRSLASEGE